MAKSDRGSSAKVIDDWEWYGFWRAIDEVLRKLPVNPTEARRALCVAANDWDHMVALAALARVLAPLADAREFDGANESDYLDKLKDWR